MLDYEEYGSNFRTPRSMRPDGGPANNGMGLDDSQPEGRPPAQDDEEAKKKQQQSGAQAPEAAAPAPQQQLTFTQMQAAGLPRPPAPSMVNPGIARYDGGPVNSSDGGSGGDLQGQIYQDYQNERNRSTPDTPQSRYTGAFDGGNSNLPDAPGSRYTGQFNGDTSGGALGGQTESAIMQALGMPSRYDSSVVKDSFGYLSGAIDDDYNQRDEGLRTSLADRGLGAPGDGTIGTSSMINQNLARRSAKQNLASELLREQANTYGADRSSAISQAMGYGGQKFGQQLQGFNANMGANESNFGQDMQRSNYGLNAQGQQFGQRLQGFNANQGANESNFNQDMQRGNFGLNAQNQNYNQRRGALQDYTNFGQNQFDNQYRTADMNQRQQQANAEMLYKLLGFGG